MFQKEKYLSKSDFRENQGKQMITVESGRIWVAEEPVPKNGNQWMGWDWGGGQRHGLRKYKKGSFNKD